VFHVRFGTCNLSALSLRPIDELVLASLLTIQLHLSINHRFNLWISLDIITMPQLDVELMETTLVTAVVMTVVDDILDDADDMDDDETEYSWLMLSN